MSRKRNIDKLLKGLQDAEPSKRRSAAHELGQSDERAIYPLIKALRDPSPGVQEAAMRSLINLAHETGREGAELVAYMVLPLLREESLLRNTALLILVEVGEIAVPLLVKMLTDKDDDIRKFALDMMAEIKRGVEPEYVVPMVKDPNANVRAAALRTLGAINHREGIEHIVEALKDEEWVSFAALETLAELREPASVPPVVGLLQSSNPVIRMNAVQALGAVGAPESADALLTHVKSLGEGDERDETIKSLVKVGITPSMSVVYDLLIGMLQHGSWEERMLALQGLVDIRDENAIPIIVDVAGALDESVPEDEERLLAVREALKSFGASDVYSRILVDEEIRFKGRVIAAELAGETGSISSVPMLIKLMDSDIRDVRRSCAMALGKLATSEAVQALMKSVGDPESNVRKMAIACLGKKGNDMAYGLLRTHLNTEKYTDIIEETVRSLLAIDDEKVFQDLGHFEERSREAIGRFSNHLSTVLALSRDPEPRVALSALSSLERFNDPRAVDRLLEATRSQDPEFRRTAVMALGGMEAGQEKIKSFLGDSDMWVRLHAVRSLGQSLKQDMLVALVPMLRDQDVPVVLAAVEAIGSIGGRDAAAALGLVADHENEEVRLAVERALLNI